MFKGSPEFTHAQMDKVGVLLTNLGTPDAPEKSALRRYLKEFLWDPRVVEVPRPLWWMILNGVILNIRPARSAAAYKTVFTEEGSPLLVHSQRQGDAMKAALAQKGRDDVVVEVAMRYGNPSIKNGIQALMDAGVRRLLVLPLYPQYSASTTASTFDAVSADFRERRWIPELRFINHYHDYPLFIEAAATRIREHWDQHGRADRLLFSYHGVPQRYLDNGDPYFCECHKTSRLLAAALGLQSGEFLTTFQSRFGKEEWLKPYTDETLKSLPAEGVTSVQVFCPGFSADCLETIEEIGEENRDYFVEAGGERYEYIAALNDHPAHIDALSELVLQHLQGWPLPQIDHQRESRARAKGAKS
ncbi:ferrochelatase 2 [Pseudohongiella nitratireducens]|uniref:Ferrochelatase n=2 Tax=Pseudohongiella nitratireducens TaxID=1768907 RepID=A0A917LQA1_9GAMM|nr:ferrochelatase [Pseudohongiella nitratireducens]GGG50883.1 ferrochelatase 2 [Pseudohongiella nitratireducens]|tara:strand:- start:4916 stop:5992 length:1077 start_codon:yes stop_codon:yes gene_type:complete